MIIDIAELKEVSGSLNVLYVEDDDLINKMMLKYLAKVFKSVIHAKDGLEGLEAYQNGSFDIVITDLSMPRMNGLDMMKKIKEINEKQSILITTAHSESKYLFGAIKMGIDGYILKPFDYPQLNQELFKISKKILLFRENEEYKNNLQEMVEEKTDEISKMMRESLHNYKETLLSMVNMIEKRDTYTAGHSKRVAEYCSMIAKEMGYSEDEVKLIYRAGILHDIGKIGTPDSILLNPKKLNDIEYGLIQEHVSGSYEILKNIPMFSLIAEIVYSHHERYDGSGYPRGLKGDDITPLARIMIVADAFDAMTTNRIYKARKSVDDALKEIDTLSGAQFDPNVVGSALKVLKDVKIDDTINQYPKDKLEEQKFAYFYKDMLTGAYNQSYLDFVLMNNNIYEMKYRYLNLFLVHDFSKYNKANGWKEGDSLLRELSIILTENLENTLVFRVFGDDFAILSENVLDISVVEKKLDEFLKPYDISLEIKSIDLALVDVREVEDIEKKL